MRVNGGVIDLVPAERGSYAAGPEHTARLYMTLRSRLSDSYQYYLPVRCTNCAATGKIFWEGLGEQKTLVRLSDEFYERLGRLPPHPIEIVCRLCGTAQLE